MHLCVLISIRMPTDVDLPSCVKHWPEKVIWCFREIAFLHLLDQFVYAMGHLCCNVVDHNKDDRPVIRRLRHT